MNTFLSIPRSDDGYVNATALCRTAGKEFNDYTRLDYTQEFLHEASSLTGLSCNELIQHRDGEMWVHLIVAVNCGTWLSPRIAFEVVNWVYDLMAGRLPFGQPPTEVIQ